MKGVSISYEEYAEYRLLKKENKRLKVVGHALAEVSQDMVNEEGHIKFGVDHPRCLRLVEVLAAWKLEYRQ